MDDKPVAHLYLVRWRAGLGAMVADIVPPPVVDLAQRARAQRRRGGGGVEEEQEEPEDEHEKEQEEEQDQGQDQEQEEEQEEEEEGIDAGKKGAGGAATQRHSARGEHTMKKMMWGLDPAAAEAVGAPLATRPAAAIAAARVAKDARILCS